MIVSNTKFQENPSSGSRVATCAQTDERSDVKLLGAFSDYLKAYEKKYDLITNLVQYLFILARHVSGLYAHLQEE